MRVPIQVTCIDERVAGLIAGAAGSCLGPCLESRVCSSVGQSAPLIRVRPEVRIFPDPPFWGSDRGAIAQLGEHLLCKQGVAGSIPAGSTRSVDSLA